MSLATEFNPIGLSYDALEALLARVRSEAPVFFWEPQSCWVFSKYEDIAAILKDRRFSNEGSLEVMNKYCPAAVEILSEGINWNKTVQLNGAEGQTHTRLRSVLQSVLSPQRFQKMEPTVRKMVAKLIDGFVADGKCDLVTQFCYPLPVMVIFDVIGFKPEEEDLRQLQIWSDDMFRLWLVPMPEDEQAKCARHAVQFQKYMRQKIAERRLSPRDDLLTEFVRQLDSGDGRLSEDELVIIFPMNLIGAGHETTKAGISNAMYQLLIKPDRWKSVVEHPESIPQVVEECLRLDGPMLGWFRVTTEEIQIAGHRLPKNANVVMLLGSANHDESKYNDPETFCPARGIRNGHLTFSAERHFCPGAPLARLEMRIAIEEMARQIPSLRLSPNQRIEYVPSVATRVINKLYVEWERP